MLEQYVLCDVILPCMKGTILTSNFMKQNLLNYERNEDGKVLQLCLSSSNVALVSLVPCGRAAYFSLILFIFLPLE